MEQTKEKNRKETTTIRGVVKRFSDQSFEFTPFGKGEPVYQEQQKFKNGVSIAVTRGQKPKKVVRMEVDADSPDLYHACVKKLDEALPTPPSIGLRCRRTTQTLMNEGGAVVTLDKNNGCITFQGQIFLGVNPNFKNQFYKLFNSINQCFAINEPTLTSAASALVKNSNI